MPDEVRTPSPGVRSAAVPAGTSERTQNRRTVERRRLNGTVVSVIDDAATAEAAIRVAARLAERFDARMLLVAVTDDLGGIGEGLTARQAEAGAKQRLQRLAAEYDVAGEDQRVVAGDPAEAVAGIAAEEAADVIVVGARRGLRQRTLRSALAADLTATASCPVVVAPPRSFTANENRRSRAA